MSATAIRRFPVRAFRRGTPRGTLRSSSSAASPSATRPSPAPAHQAVQKTHYALFPISLPHGPPPAGPFPVDARALRREFLSLQSVAHPDRQHATPTPASSDAASAHINDAYRTLLSSLPRAQYLLALRGIDVSDERARLSDVALLAEVLDVREAIEEAQGEADIAALREVNEGRIRASEEVLADAFARDELERAAEEAVRLRYWVNVRESLEGWEPGKPVVLVH
ncbi:MAG: hypothetical protein M1832_002095 [Thelocarpon impressellum]|nr:MAG: hypothetical protein M1832_002095 [Thelocarpon impressellum]